jgi:hypothetical protein
MNTRRWRIRLTRLTAILATGVWGLHAATAVSAAATAPTSVNAVIDAELSGKGTLRRMAPSSLTAAVVVGQEPGVKIEEQPVDQVPANPTFAPFSVNIYEFPVKQ